MNLGDETKNDLKISCSLCEKPTGWKGREKGLTSVVVVVSDIACVDGRIWKRSGDEGIWSKEDGCLFSTAFYPFCSDQVNCLGLHVVATDSSNVQLLNTVLFYSERLEIQHIDTSTTNNLILHTFQIESDSLKTFATFVLLNQAHISPSSVTSLSKGVSQNPFEKFAYTSPQTNSMGWRTTISKVKNL
uniref:Uncharacterized protein n=1 Tax=Lactuca sativa TaxID=4236 RepID=A0A9R1XND7_LACSA|nr:hypothetical protein LSAT_V11C200051250 [Lactuca sativa]